MKEESLLLLSDLQILINQVVFIDYTIIILGGAKTRYQWNMDAIRTLKQIESESRIATPEEQKVLSKFVGWGGLSQAFDEENAG